MTDLPEMSKVSRQKMMEIIFEQFGCSSIYIANQAVMSLYSLGILSGIVVDIGNRMQVVPVVEGFSMDSARYQLTGSIADLTGNLAHLMTERGYYYRTSGELEEVR